MLLPPTPWCALRRESGGGFTKAQAFQGENALDRYSRDDPPLVAEILSPSTVIHAEAPGYSLACPCQLNAYDPIARVCGEIWTLYGDLKAFKNNPHEGDKAGLAQRFDELFTHKTGFETLKQLLKRIHGNKDELLRVLERPEIALHTNGSETDIRDYVKKRKVSGGTRSDIVSLMCRAEELGHPPDWLIRSKHNRTLPEGGKVVGAGAR